jgi:hypothetical protein
MGGRGAHRVSSLLAPGGWLDLAKPAASNPALSDADGDCTRVGGAEVLFHNDAYFAKVRARYGVDKRCVATAAAFDWGAMQPSLGKGGDAMAFSADGRYIVKELGSDHRPLVAITRDYVEHVCGDSLLARFLIHFYHPQRRKNYVVMNCWTPKTPAALQHTPDNLMELYDLKGCADDKAMRHNYKSVPQKHRRCWNCFMDCPCSISQERAEYKRLKRGARTLPFSIQWEEKKRIMSKLQSDAQFLRTHGLMDYSLIIGIKRCEEERFKREILAPRGGFLPGDDGGRDQAQPYYAVQKTENGTVEVIGYYLGIIDFLQPWTCGKRVAHQIKCCDRKPLATVTPAQFGTRFEDYFEQKFKVNTRVKAPEWLVRSRELSSGGSVARQGDGAGSGAGGGGVLGASKEVEHVLGGARSPVRAEDIRVARAADGGGSGTTTGAEKGGDVVVAPSPAKQIAAGALMFASAAAIAAFEYTAVTAASGGL